MTFTAFLGFSAAMILLAASPGPGVFGVVSRSLASGFRKTLFMIAGIVTGDILFLVSAIFGMSWLAKNLSQVFVILRYAGGAYLIWLGIKTFFARIREDRESASAEDIKPGAAYLSGLFITLSNPKVVVFYCGFLPVFMDLEHLLFWDGVFVSLLVMLILGSVMVFYALLGASAARFVRSDRRRRILNRGAGGIMVFVGISLFRTGGISSVDSP